jgi:hypothetical protein
LILALGLFAGIYSAKVMAGFQGIANQVGVIWVAVVTVAAMENRMNLLLIVVVSTLAANAWGWQAEIALLVAFIPEFFRWI